MKSSRLRIVEQLTSALSALAGAAVLLGLALDMPVLKSVLPGMAAAMQATTALCFLLSGVAFWLSVPEVITGKARLVAIISSALVLLAGGLTLAEYLFNWNFGFHGPLFQDTANAAAAGRMTPKTALAFVLLNMALLLLTGSSRRALRAAAGLLGALTALLGLFAVLGFMGIAKLGYGWDELTSMALLNTGGLFLLLGSACAARAWRRAEVVQWFGTSTDIDELKRMEESLRASQARLNSTLAAVSIGTWTWDVVNDRLIGDEFIARMFAVETAAAAKGLPVEVYLRAVVKEDQPVVAAALARAIQCCGLYDVEYRVRQENGELHWLQAKGRVEGDAAGKAVQFHGAVMDITERKRSEGRFRRLIDSNAQGVMFWNKKGAITRANDAFLRIVGYSREDMEAGGIDWAAITPLEYAHLDQRGLEEVVARGICTPFEKEYIRKDGSRVPVLVGAAIFEDSPDEGICFVIDITERKRTDQALRESEEHFRFLNDLSEATRMLGDPATIMAVTARMLGEHLAVSSCAYANVEKDGESFSIVHDYTAGGASAVGVYPLSVFGRRAAATLECGQTLIIRNLEAEVLPEDGPDMVHPIGSKATIVCPIAKDGRLRAMMTVSQTTTREWKSLEIVLVQAVVERCWALVERETAEENIRRINAELEQRVVERTAAAEASNMAKSVFLSTMSHEIRTPLNAILGYVQLMLRDASLGSDAKANLKIIGRSGDHLLALINDVLDISKIEAGRTELNVAKFNLQNLLSDLANVFRLRAESKALGFSMFSVGDFVAYVVADEGKVRQALINLLGNAVKFTKRGHIMLRIALDERKDNRLWLSARVEDTGSGISDEEQERLFEPFRQAELGINSNEGTGLGLAITRQYARLMGGDVTVSSIVGKGSIFHFEIPVGRSGSGIAPSGPAPSRVMSIRGETDRPEILVVDDQLDNRDWLVRLLASVGFSVRDADNGEAAIRAWEERKPHMILMDVHMPVMDGLEATRRIKADPRGRETAIVVLTASAMDDERRLVLESGADDFLTKPCREEDLFATIGALLKIAYNYEETGGAAGEPAAGLPILSTARLGQLPLELTEELREATLSGKKKLLNKVISKVRENDNAGLAYAIQDLADRYRYDVLAQLLEEACRR